MATFTGADKAIGFLFDMVSNIADDYDAATTYAQGNYTIYAGTLYKCISAISAPEDFTPAHWQAVLVMDEVAAGGGGGGGTTVIANPAGAATDTLNKLQVGATIYDIPSGGGSSGHTYSTTEQIVGTWIDGKTIYEKTVEFQTPKQFSNGWIACGTGLVPINGGVVSCRAIDTMMQVHPCGCSVDGELLFYLAKSDLSNYSNRYVKYLIIQYTKPVA